MDAILSRWLAVGLVILTAWPAVGGAEPQPKRRFFIVDSYHREYSWSHNVAKGFCDGMRHYGYLETDEEAERCLAMDTVESSRAVMQRAWMDTKRWSDKDQMLEATVAISAAIKDFQPDLLFLGDDNAANYIGQQFLDTTIPVVFWGVNNTPVKYGLVDSAERPGHNVTGVYQSGYYVETLELLKALVPSVKTVAILSDDSETGRSHYKAIEYLAGQGALPVELVATVATNEFAVWKQKALELQERADAFFLPTYASLKDESGNNVPGEVVARWHLTHVHRPEATGIGAFVQHGLLCAADDSGYNQGLEAVRMAHDILARGKNPATYPPRAPKRGALIVNRQRARMLGIDIPDGVAEEIVEEASALKEPETGKP